MRYFLLSKLHFVGVALCFVSYAADKLPRDSELLRQGLTIEGVREHQRALQDIAMRTNNNRMAGTEGYRQSVAYVAERLRNAGYIVRLQDFSIRIADDLSPPELKQVGPEQQDFLAGVDFLSMSFSGMRELTGNVHAVDLKIPSLRPNDSNSACEPEDFANFKPGDIALIQRGSCSFNSKVEHAKKAGALAVIIFNEGNEGRTELFSSRLDELSADFPVLSARYSVGEKLYNQKASGPTANRISIKINISNSARTVQNIIAETAEGNNNRVVVVGAHLDSVGSGPGINDNGSGSAAILEIAEQYSALKLKPLNKLRFIWFGAEEFGLVGSEFYVDSLNASEREKIMAMLNFDMLGSPNYARFVYDGDNSGRTELNAVEGPAGSALIEKIFLDYFAHNNMATHPTAFNGRSDYGPFIRVGIPAGGLFSGAEEIKSPRMAEIYGGKAYEPFDPCYHRRCDNLEGTEGLALKSLSELSQAAAHAVATIAMSDQEIRPPHALPIIIPEYPWEYKGHMLVR